jgi:diadenosine tetraphosphate (Ap4A) HIT family hydrolase
VADDEWKKKIAGEDCPLCADPSKECEIIGDLEVTRAYLQRSASFRGYCVLVLKRHAVELDDLSADERRALMEDIALVARAVRAVCKPRKLNYEILGNMVPHIHVHIIPRYETDPAWDRAAWFALPDESSLSDEEYAALADELRAEIGR